MILRLETGTGQHPRARSNRVPPEMIYDKVFAGEQELIAWHGDVKAAFRLQYLGEASERCNFIFDVLENIEKPNGRYAG